MKHFSLKVWAVTSFCMLLGASSLFFLSRVVKLLFGTFTDAAVWFLSNVGNFKRAFISLCVVIAVFYGVRIVRAITLWLEAKARQERNAS